MGKSGFVMLAAGALVASLLPAAAVAAPTQTDATFPIDQLTASRDTPRLARGIVVKTRASAASVLSSVRRAARATGLEAEDVEAPADLTESVTVVDFATVVPFEDAAEAARAVAARDDVEWAIPNGRVRATAAAPNAPNDPFFEFQHQLWDAEAASAGGFGTKMPLLWKEAKGAGTVVAVLDTGIRDDHPDLRGQLVDGYDMIAADTDVEGEALPAGHPDEFYTANDGDGRDPDASDPGDWIPQGDTTCYGPDEAPLEEQEDSSWHGTHVAGIIAARQNDGFGISGVAPRAKLQSVRVLGRCGGWDSDILAGIAWASGGAVEGVPDNPTPASVINLSLGQYLEGYEEYLPALCAAYGDAMRGALERHAVTIVAAGNEGGNADLAVPAACPGAISVAAVSRAGRAAFYTNKGSSVDVAAYGGDFALDDVGVVSTVDEGRSGPVGPNWAEYMGTSMAAPAVSGVAAALLAGGRIQAPDVEDVLERTVQPFAPTGPEWERYTITPPGGAPFTADLNCTSSRCGAGVVDVSRLGVTVYLHFPWARSTYGKGLEIDASANMHDRWSAQGSVELVRGSTVLARLPLDGGGWAASPTPRTALPAGTYAVRARYAGRWISEAKTVIIAKASSQVTQSIASSVSRKKGASLVVTVRVAGVAHPTGELRVYDGKKRIATRTLSSTGAGRKSITLPRLARGKHKIKTVYVGNRDITGRTSTIRTVTSK